MTVNERPARLFLASQRPALATALGATLLLAVAGAGLAGAWRAAGHAWSPALDADLLMTPDPLLSGAHSTIPRTPALSFPARSPTTDARGGMDARAVTAVGDVRRNEPIRWSTPAQRAFQPVYPSRTSTHGGRTMANLSRPRAVALPITPSYVDRSSAAYFRFRAWVDTAVAGQPGYAFAASEAALMYGFTGATPYCTLAVAMVEQQVAAAEARIAAGANPAVASDSYLEVGTMIADLSQTLAACQAGISASQRLRWSAYAEQAVWNVWNHENARWGGRLAPWTGWSTDNPGNNYYYSFVEATMFWALASGNNAWLIELRDRRLPLLQAYFAALPGGGSSEGTGYGTSHMRLFSIYNLWREATGADLANANSHATDSIPYWIHATVPTRDRFAPIGDQSRNSIPELYDYHRRLMLEARYATQSEPARNAATWWLGNISVTRMSSGFNFRYDLLPTGSVATVPSELTYHAQGTGHLFSRTGWDTGAMWVAIVAGPYTESHAHQDQGSFTLFSGDWLAVTANIWSNSGINQGTDVHNLVRFVRSGIVARQCESTTRRSTLALTRGSGGAFTAQADLTPAFCANSPVSSWRRHFDFSGRRLTVRDTFSMATGTTATFQVNTPVLPTLVNSREAVAGRLRVRVLEPANATINGNFSTGKYLEDGGRYRIDVSGGTTGYLVELSEI